MPDRMFREGWLTSLKINQLFDGAEAFLFRLGLRADKNGVYHGEPELLRNAVYPLKTTLRVAEVIRRRDMCVAAGLLRLWTGSDGRPYVQILKFGQKTTFERPKFPLPPGEPDDTGQEQLPIGDGSPPEVKRSKVKRGGREIPPPPVLKNGHETDERWLVRLESERPDIDVREQLRLAEVAKRKQGRTLERGWFEDHWLPKATPQVGTVETATATPAPEGWQQWVDEHMPEEDDRAYGVVRGALDTDQFSRLPKSWQAKIRRELGS